MTAMQLRFYNEVATLLLFAIVFTVVFKNLSSWAYGVGGILGLGVLLSLGVMFYRKVRRGKS
jgi:putative membrane protein